MHIPYRVFWTSIDDRLQKQTVLVRDLTKVGVEAVIADAQREAARNGLPVPLLPVAAALDQLALRGASGDAFREGRSVRPRGGFDGDFKVGDQDAGLAEAFGGFVVGACETDAARREAGRLIKAGPRWMRSAA